MLLSLISGYFHTVGKVLDAKSHLRDTALTNGSKIMMIGSGGDLHNVSTCYWKKNSFV
jgi:hypothetical protein